MISDWRGVLSAVCRGKVNKKRRRRASSKGWHKTGGAYETQKLKGFENFREVPARQIDAAVSRPWAPDGADMETEKRPHQQPANGHHARADDRRDDNRPCRADFKAI